MADSLVIVESPAKAKTIGKYLAANTLLKHRWAIFAIFRKAKLASRLRTTLNPKYITIRGKG